MSYRQKTHGAMEPPTVERSNVDWLDQAERGGDPSHYREVVEALLWRGQRQGLPIVTRHPARQAFYVAQRLDGNSHKLAEMFAAQCPPSAMTDAVFLEGHCNGSQFAGTPAVGDHYQRLAAEAGVSVKGKVYLGGLAAYPGDPRAWVDGRGDVQRLAAERGLTVSGAVNYTPPERAPAPDVVVADDLVWNRVLDKVEADPAVALRPKEEVFAETREEMKPHWSA